MRPLAFTGVPRTCDITNWYNRPGATGIEAYNQGHWTAPLLILAQRLSLVSSLCCRPLDYHSLAAGAMPYANVNACVREADNSVIMQVHTMLGKLGHIDLC
jgi:hypothetical protein